MVNTSRKAQEVSYLGFIFLVILEAALLLCAGIIFFGGVRGALLATAALSGINFLVHDLDQFLFWEPRLLLGGVVGSLLLLVVGKIANKSQVVNGLVGGLISLVLFGAFVTPIVAIILWALVVGTGIIPKGKKSQILWSFAPTVLRVILGISLIIYGNILTL